MGVRLIDEQRRDPLGMAVGLGQTGVDDQAVAVLHQRMPHEAELGLLARPFAIETRAQGRSEQVKPPFCGLTYACLVTYASAGRLCNRSAVVMLRQFRIAEMVHVG